MKTSRKIDSNKVNRSVISVVERNICVGCGTCAVVCTEQCLKMIFNKYGELIPVVNGTCTKCGLCYSICPFGNENQNESQLSIELSAKHIGINSDEILGNYTGCYVGFVQSRKQRWQRSSGGLATWFLAELLRQDKVDIVLCVMTNRNPQKLFTFSSLSDPGRVLSSAKSCYYPVEWSGVLRDVISDKKRFAVIGLPCYLKSLRRYAIINSEVRDLCRVLVGITCGQNKSKLFADYLIRMSGGDPQRVQRISFREKILESPASDFAFSFFTDEKTKGSIQWSKGYGHAFIDGYFKLNACNYCDDVFADVADISFMDAWLDPWKSDCTGTNLVITRSVECQSILDDGHYSNEINIEKISAIDIARSQKGVVSNKTEGLAFRLSVLSGQNGKPLLKKRVDPSPAPGFFKRMMILDTWKVQEASKKAMIAQQDAGHGISVFQREFHRSTRRIRLIRGIINLTGKMMARIKRIW